MARVLTGGWIEFTCSCSIGSYRFRTLGPFVFLFDLLERQGDDVFLTSKQSMDIYFLFMISFFSNWSLILMSLIHSRIFRSFCVSFPLLTLSNNSQKSVLHLTHVPKSLSKSCLQMQLFHTWLNTALPVKENWYIT